MGIVNQDGALYLATGIDNSGLEKGLRDAEKKIEDFGKNAEKAGGALTKALEESTDAIKELTKALEKKKEIVSSLEDGYENIKNTLENTTVNSGMDEEYQKARDLLVEVNAELKEEKAIIELVETAQRKENQATKEAAENVSVYNGSLEELSKQIEEQRKKLSLLIQDQNDAYNNVEDAQFRFDNPDIKGIDPISSESLAVVKSRFEEINKAVEENRNILNALDRAYEEAFNDISISAEKARDSVSKINKDFGSDSIKIGVNDIESSLSSLEKSFSKIKGNSGIISDKIIEEQKAYLSELREIQKEVDALEKYTQNERSSNDQLSKSYENSKRILNEVNKEIKLVATSINNIPKTPESFTTQIRKIKEEMVGLELQGKKESVRYRELQAELERTGTAYKKVQQEQKNLTTAGSATISGLLSGMSAISGAFSAGSGVVSLFVKDNDRLAAIQTKLQAAMAITIGLQQVSTTLHSTSSFRMNVVTKVTNAFAVANTRLAVGLGISTVAAKALMATLTLGLSVAITGIVFLIDKTIDKQKELSEQVKKNKERLEQYNKNIADSASAPLASYKRLQAQWSKLTSDLKGKEKFVNDNKKEFEALGIEVNNVVDAEKALVDNTEAVIKSLSLKARAMATQSLAMDTYKEAIEKQEEARKRALSPTQQEVAHSKSVYEYKDVDGYKNVPHYVGTEASIEAAKKIQDKANKLFEKGDSLTKEQIELLEKARKELKDNGIKTTGGNASTATKTKSSEPIIDGLKQENEKIKALLEYRNSLLDNQQKLLDLEEDGFEKRQKQIELNHKKELLTIEKNAQELIEKRQQEEYKQWKLDNPNTKKTFKTSIKSVFDLSTDDQKLLSDSTVIADKTRQKANEDLLKSLLSKYQDYTEQRELVEKQFNQDISALEKSRTQENSKQIDIALSEASKKKKEALSSINMNELRNSIDWQKVFGDLDRVSADTIKNLKDKLKTYIQEAGNNLTPTDLKALTEAITQLEQKYAQLKPNKAFTESFDEYKEATENVKKLKKELDEIKKGREVIIGIDYNKETGKMTPILKTVEHAEKDLTAAQEKRRLAMYKLSVAMDAYNERLQNYIGLARSVVDTFSDFGIEVPEGIQMMVDGISKVSEGVADFSEGLKNGNPVQMIQGGVKALGGIAKTIKGLFGGNVNKEHREALKLLEAQRKQLQHIVALEKLREDLNYKQGETIFGSDKWGKARNGAVNYAKSVKELQKSLQDLEDVDVVTGSKKSGWGPWKKRKDVWSDLLSAYPELIDANGEFDKTLAQTILTTQKLDDEGKIAIQNAIDNAELVEEAYAAMKDQLTDIFGNLGSSITDAFVDAFRNGTDAAKTATDNIGKMLEDLVAQMVYSLTLGPLMEEYSDKMMEISSNKNLTDKEKLDGYINTIGSMMDEAMAQQALANELLGYAQDKAKEQGIEIFKPDSSTSQTASFGSSQNMDQDTGNRIEGRVTAIQMSEIKIEKNTAELVLLVSQNNTVLKGFESNFQEIKNIGLQSMYYLADINKNTRELYVISEQLMRIEQNTSKL